MRWKRGVARKKDALESAHRDNQRVGPVVGFEHAVQRTAAVCQLVGTLTGESALPYLLRISLQCLGC